MTFLSKILCCVLLCICCSSCNQDKASKPRPRKLDISTSALRNLIETDQQLVILDVRTPKEIAGGMIPNAVHMDYRADNFNEMISTLDTNATVVVYCHRGGRAGKACKELKKNGHDLVYNYGGYQRWLTEGD